MPYDPKAAGEAKLTNVEIDMLQSMLNAHDRGGFYMAYAAMSGSKESELQASISTFSENVGGIALAANRIIQTWIGVTVTVHLIDWSKNGNSVQILRPRVNLVHTDHNPE